MTAELAAESAGMILRWAVHPEPVDVELAVVEAPPEACDPICHPGRPLGDRAWPQFWLVVPIRITRRGKWEFEGRFDGFYSIYAPCDTVESTFDMAKRTFLKCHNREPHAADSGDFVFETIVEPESRNFDEDDDGGWTHIPGTTMKWRPATEAEVKARREEERGSSERDECVIEPASPSGEDR